jgi:hypothetical protein
MSDTRRAALTIGAYARSIITLSETLLRPGEAPSEIERGLFAQELDVLCRHYDVTIGTFKGETLAVSKRGWEINLEDAA